MKANADDGDFVSVVMPGDRRMALEWRAGREALDPAGHQGALSRQRHVGHLAGAAFRAVPLHGEDWPPHALRRICFR
jgi:hypothetical protein